MWILELIAIGTIALLAALLLLCLRRWWLVRPGGTIEVYLRVSTLVIGRGWSHGFARFTSNQLRWYRTFSFSPRPRRVLSRRGLAVESRRAPAGSERMSLPDDWVILRCINHHAPVEIAMAPSTVTGFSSWIESAPPGTVSRYSYHSPN